ncbi:MurR/RpiR family transcriptional regulator [Agrococcus sp. Marseille-P2731]|uniref:MurR/RpiR family transcriptional regulator n=1 Tax=Agrococcus sp. Marseille-P2731 TaxID=1841862 RepID=UPI0009312B25|nr:MurR/RpiR family transcriptional regulator [Agrococcus sp. Marseille-P2731]
MWPQTRPSLTRLEQAVALFALERPLQFATASGSEIAQHTGTSEATVARTAQKLGFDNIKEMKAYCANELHDPGNLQTVLRSRLDAVSVTDEDDPSASAAAAMAPVLRSAAALTLGVHDSIDWGVAARAVDACSAASSITLYGLGTASFMAGYADLEFARIGLRSRAVTGGGHANADAAFRTGTDDAVLIVAPRAMFPDVERFAAAALRLTSRVFIITQGAVSADLRSAGAEVLRLPPTQSSAATEAASTMALIDALVAEIARRHPRRAMEARQRAQAYRSEFSR